MVPPPAAPEESLDDVSDEQLDFQSPGTLNLEDLIISNIEAFHSNPRTTHGFLQMFPPAEEPEPLWDHSPQFLIGDAKYCWEDSMETTEVVDDIALALLPRTLFETSDSDDSVFEPAGETELMDFAKRNGTSSTNNHFLEDNLDNDELETAYDAHDGDNDGDDEAEDPPHTDLQASSLRLRRSERSTRGSMDYSCFHNTGVRTFRK